MRIRTIMPRLTIWAAALSLLTLTGCREEAENESGAPDEIFVNVLEDGSIATFHNGEEINALSEDSTDEGLSDEATHYRGTHSCYGDGGYHYSGISDFTHNPYGSRYSNHRNRGHQNYFHKGCGIYRYHGRYVCTYLPAYHYNYHSFSLGYYSQRHYWKWGCYFHGNGYTNPHTRFQRHRGDHHFTRDRYHGRGNY